MGPGGEPFFWRPERPVLGAKGELQLGGLFPSQREWWDLPGRCTLMQFRAICRVLRECRSRRSAARLVGIAPQTLSDWCRKVPEFAAVLDAAEEQGAFVLTTQLFNHAKGGDKSALHMILKMRVRDFQNRKDEDKSDEITEADLRFA
jgi:transposase-like protein